MPAAPAPMNRQIAANAHETLKTVGSTSVSWPDTTRVSAFSKPTTAPSGTE